jgi:hypothetical protein
VKYGCNSFAIHIWPARVRSLEKAAVVRKGYEGNLNQLGFVTNHLIQEESDGTNGAKAGENRVYNPRLSTKFDRLAIQLSAEEAICGHF